MKGVAVLQARTTSSRLPGKVLLPVNGMPTAILAARRAANRGREVIIATSSEPADNALAGLAVESGFRCFRGSLEDTLGRVVSALAGFSDDTPVIRLTADNVFPDGTLLDEIEEEFTSRRLDYLSCSGEGSGLPYGVSAEITRVGHLRDAALLATDMHDREHVTPYVRRKFGHACFTRYSALRKEHFRCTVDCLDDYLVLQEVFCGVPDPVHASVLELIERLEGATYQPLQPRPAHKLVLGTAQLGSPYGIANHTGQPEGDLAEKLIKTAISNGVLCLDTARAYGVSEQVIGNALRSGWEGRAKVITKLSPLTDCPADASRETIDAFVDASLYRSCASLRVQKIEVLMLHRAIHLAEWGGGVWERLLEHKAQGTVQALGMSVQDPAELRQALGEPEICVVQMPFNVLDWRWEELIPEIRAKRAERGLVVHVRSALLQGLLASNETALWHRANVMQPEAVMNWLVTQQQAAAMTSVAQFCLSFVKSLDWVDGVVVGMESPDQLEQNILTFSGPDLAVKDIEAICASRPVLADAALNPTCWRAAG